MIKDASKIKSGIYIIHTKYKEYYLVNKVSHGFVYFESNSGKGIMPVDFYLNKHHFTIGIKK